MRESTDRLSGVQQNFEQTISRLKLKYLSLKLSYYISCLLKNLSVYRGDEKQIFFISYVLKIGATYQLFLAVLPKRLSSMSPQLINL